MTRWLTPVFLITSLSVLISAARAETVPDKDLPKSGNLSSTFITGSKKRMAAEPFGFDELNRDVASPISGSVSRGKADEWVLKVFNNSVNDTYSVDVEVVQLSESSTVAKRDRFSYTIAPGASKVQSVTGASNVKGAQLNLLKWRNLTAQKLSAKKRELSKNTQQAK